MDQHQHRQQQHQLASSPIAQSPSHADKDKNVAVAGPKHASTAAMAPSKSRAVFDFLEFVNSSPSPYHTVRSAAARLEAAGFSKISERNAWGATVRPGGKYYLTRNGSSIVAFAVGARWRPGGAVGIVGAHTDSPCLRIKPVSRRAAAGFLQVGVETYGGGIWHTWFDRDLSVAGRAMVRDADGNFVQRLVTVERPILRIPSLAIHLDRSADFVFNKEQHLYPIAGLVAAELNKKKSEEEEEEGGDEHEEDEGATADKKEGAGGNTPHFKPLSPMTERHSPAILQVVADNIGVDVADIIDFELVLHDTQPACLGGLADEFVFAPRLDNLDMTYCAVAGLAASVADPSALDDDCSVRMIACFDHEEIGSVSAQGAASSLLADVLRRLAALPAVRDDESYDHASPVSRASARGTSGTSAAESGSVFEQMMARSFLLSADMAHSVHPNYTAKYEQTHHPLVNGGPVIKVNANQRYATNSPGIVLVQECARLRGVPLQLFVVRNDSPCGSTIGPMLSAKLGLRTLDLGNPQLAMHSIRETGGSRDVDHGIGLFEAFFENYGRLEAKFVVD
jgi:aspartyl aminopeptidase